MRPLAIIGLDPGTTSAYTILDLDGKVLRSHAAKELSLSQMISEIIEVCQPIIVSTDKAKIPSFVEQCARKLGAVIASPDEDLQREEKHRMVGVGYKGDHDEDSLAAALCAYKRYQPRIQKAQEFIAAHQLHQVGSEFLRLAMTENFNFTLIKEMLTKPSPEQTIIKEVALNDRINKKDFLQLYRRLQRVQEEKQAMSRGQQELRQRMNDIERENHRLYLQSQHFNRKLDQLLRFKEERLALQQKELKGQHSLMQQLNDKILSLYQFIEKMEQYQLVKKLKSLSYREFMARNTILKVADNDVLWVENPTIFSQRVLDQLTGRGVIIISPVKLSKTIQAQFQAVHFPGTMLLENDYFALLEREGIEKQLNSRSMVQDIVREYRQQRE
ncbi:DUF460 domain-containing protein [Candidatus Woesearchaeota archaeon]|nr:DUF460 domain-containing protein [Candidatus Woesearchaeota archaeon]